MNDRQPYDVAIVGAGGAGGMLALALAGRGLDVVAIEATPPAVPDPELPDQRGLALSQASVGLMRSVGLWDALAMHATPIEHIHVSKAGVFGTARFHAADVGLAALAHVVPGNRLAHALEGRLIEVARRGELDMLRPASVSSVTPGPESVRLTLVAPDAPASIDARLVVGADGSDSTIARLCGFVRHEHDYDQTALVAVVSGTPGHRNTAYERFTRSGPVALLPVADDKRVAVVVKDAGDAERLLASGPEAFAAEVSSAMGGRLFDVAVRSPVRPWPLRRIVTDDVTGPRTVLLGNAANTVHPNGAQGLNLALKDVAELAARLVDADVRTGDPGAAPVLADYRAARRRDQRLTTAATHAVALGSRLSGLPGRLAYHGLFGLLAHVPALGRPFLTRATVGAAMNARSTEVRA